MGTHYKLRDWIPIHKLDWGQLSRNPLAIRLLESQPENIDWKNLSSNEYAIHLIEKNMDKISWELLSSNPRALHIHPFNFHFGHFVKNDQNEN